MTISFSELSKNSKRVADVVERTQRVHVRRRDGEDLYLTTARHDEQRAETAGGRVRYLVDERRRTVHVVYASPRHPRDTDLV